MSDTSEFTDEQKNTKKASEFFQMKRIPRDIDIDKESELQECDRIMQNYITLLKISNRSLKRSYINIDEKVPLIGTGLNDSETVSYNEKRDSFQKDADEVWANHLDTFQKMAVEKGEESEYGVEQYLKNRKAKGITVKRVKKKDDKNSRSGEKLSTKTLKKSSKSFHKNHHSKSKNLNPPSRLKNELLNDSVVSVKSTNSAEINVIPEESEEDIEKSSKEQINNPKKNLKPEDLEKKMERCHLMDDPLNPPKKKDDQSIIAEVLPKKKVELFIPDTNILKKSLDKRDLKKSLEQEKIQREKNDLKKYTDTDINNNIPTLNKK